VLYLNLLEMLHKTRNSAIIEKLQRNHTVLLIIWKHQHAKKTITFAGVIVQASTLSKKKFQYPECTKDNMNTEKKKYEQYKLVQASRH